MATAVDAAREGLDTTTPDPGFFGPGSVSWRVHHDPAALVGGLRALLLQSLHPGVMHAFATATGVKDDPWGRLVRTAGYVNVIVYGTHREAEEAAARVRRVHARLGLDRPDWLLWVHNGAVESWLRAHRASGAPMTDDEADEYVREQLTAAELVGCPVDEVPRNAAALRAYLDDMRPRLHAGAEAQEAARGILWPPMTPRMQWLTPARPLWTVAALTAFGLLPRWARGMFTPPASTPSGFAAALSARALRTALIAVPEQRRTSPHVAAAWSRLG